LNVIEALKKPLCQIRELNNDKEICKSCAYRISDIVIEGDGEEIKIKRKELK